MYKKNNSSHQKTKKSGDKENNTRICYIYNNENRYSPRIKKGATGIASETIGRTLHHACQIQKGQ